MKTYLGKYFMVGLLAVWFTSCNDDAFLVEKPMTFLVPENTFTSPSGIRQGISGLHAAVRNGWYLGEELQEHGSIYKGLGTDVAFFGDNPGATIFLCNYETYLTPTTEVVEINWDRAYQIIQRANVLIQAIDDVPGERWDSSEQKEAYKAEAMFFRAWAYRLLTSFYGACPVIDYVISEPKTDFERDPVEQAYLLMESDLIFGTGNLPDPGKEEEKGRITKGAAWQLLCEVYLAQHRYQDAVTAATNVLTRFNYQLMIERFGSTVDVFGSGDVYLDLFAFGNQNIAENTEAIWVLQFEPLTTDGYANARGGRAFGPAYFRVNFTPDGFKAIRGELYNGTYTGYSDTLGRGVAWLRPTTHVTHEIWHSDWDNDIRNAPHNIKRDFYYDAPGSAYDKQKIDFSLYPPGTRNAVIDTCQYIYPFFM
ncbi:MAG: RagB/SusD family nutrient uptake outer membrane protein, partial [Tannerella sp.]|nr:RagB/SusD family nutrient uptake outer membrane protein [Tannerella sp.]